MPNARRPGLAQHTIWVEPDLWAAAKTACDTLGTTRAAVMRDALRKAVRDAARKK